MGFLEVMKKSGIKEVSKFEFLNQSFNESIFVHFEYYGL